ncbi:hypothetical protein APY03_1443 [Variovorax sp. WDL1]|nr:hypothetical protein APY03_1443 [Variovorax sp. WDL1]
MVLRAPGGVHPSNRLGRRAVARVHAPARGTCIASWLSRAASRIGTGAALAWPRRPYPLFGSCDP